MLLLIIFVCDCQVLKRNGIIHYSLAVKEVEEVDCDMGEGVG